MLRKCKRVACINQFLPLEYTSYQIHHKNGSCIISQNIKNRSCIITYQKHACLEVFRHISTNNLFGTDSTRDTTTTTWRTWLFSTPKTHHIKTSKPDHKPNHKIKITSKRHTPRLLPLRQVASPKTGKDHQKCLKK